MYVVHVTPSGLEVHPLPESEFWTVQKIKEQKQQVDVVVLKEPSDIHGIINNPIWDFIEPMYMVFPELHVKIGLVNNVLDNFYSFIDDHVEAPPEEEECSQNSYIVADVALTKAVERLDDWKETDDVALQGHRW